MKKQKYNEEIIQDGFRGHQKKLTPELFEELSKYKVKKSETISRLHAEYEEPVLILRANYPGLNKMNNSTKLIVKEASINFEEIFKKRILYRQYYETLEGPIIFYVVKGDSKTLKENSIFIEENHELGRFIDIDVYDVNDDYRISRMDLYYKPRNCFLCDKPAFECSRNKEHTEEELINHLKSHLKRYLEKNNKEVKI